MNEYQYCEFQTADRRLSEKEMQELRSYSTRAVITPTSFSNEYSFGSLPNGYDQAVQHLVDLRDLAVRKGAEADFSRRLALLRETHSRKPSFIRRLQDKGLGP
jgi:hypothetical protein